MKEEPVTMTEIQMRLSRKERERLLLWLTTGKNVIGNEIRVSLYKWQAGELGQFVCEIKGWEPTPNTNQEKES